METIVEKFILQLEAQLAERHVAITLTPEARAWLAAKGYDPVFGARPLARVIQKEVRDPLTDEILFGALEHGGTVTIGAPTTSSPSASNLANPEETLHRLHTAGLPPAGPRFAEHLAFGTEEVECPSAHEM